MYYVTTPVSSQDWLSSTYFQSLKFIFEPTVHFWRLHRCWWWILETTFVADRLKSTVLTILVTKFHYFISLFYYMSDIVLNILFLSVTKIQTLSPTFKSLTSRCHQQHCYPFDSPKFSILNSASWIPCMAWVYQCGNARRVGQPGLIASQGCVCVYCCFPCAMFTWAIKTRYYVKLRLGINVSLMSHSL